MLPNQFSSLDFSSRKSTENSVNTILKEIRKKGISKKFQFERFQFETQLMGIIFLVVCIFGMIAVKQEITMDELEFFYEVLKERFPNITLCTKHCSIIFANKTNRFCPTCSSRCSMFCEKCFGFFSYNNFSRHKKKCDDTKVYPLNDPKVIQDMEENDFFNRINQTKPYFHKNENSYVNLTENKARKRKYVVTFDSKNAHYLPIESYDEVKKKRKVNYMAIGSSINNNKRKPNERPNLKKVSESTMRELLPILEYRMNKYPTLKLKFNISAENKKFGEEEILNHCYYVHLTNGSNSKENAFAIEKVRIVSEMFDPKNKNIRLQALRTWRDQWFFMLEFLMNKVCWQKNKEKYGFCDYSTISKNVQKIREKNIDLFFVHTFSNDSVVLCFNIQKLLERLLSDVEYRTNLLQEIVSDFYESLRTDFKDTTNFDSFVFCKRGNQGKKKNLSYDSNFSVSESGEIIFNCCLNFTPDGTSCGNTDILDLWGNFCKFTCSDRRKENYIPVMLGNKIKENYETFKECFGRVIEKWSLNSKLEQINKRRSFGFVVTESDLDKIFLAHKKNFFSQIKPIYKGIYTGKIRVKFSFCPDLKCSQGFINNRIISPLFDILKKMNHDLYVDESGNLRNIEQIHLPSEFIRSLMKGLTPNFLKLYYREKKDSDVLNFEELIQLLIDALHCSFSFGRCFLTICISTSQAIEFLVDHRGFKKRSNEYLTNIIVIKHKIIEDIESLDVRDDAVNKLFSNDFLESLTSYYKERVREIKAETIKKIVESCHLTEEELTLGYVKESLQDLISLMEIVVPKTSSLFKQLTDGKRKTKKECLKLAEDSDFSVLFMLLSYFANKTIPHYLLLIQVIIYQIFEKKRNETNHVPENLNSLFKFITLYHSSKFKGSFNEKLVFKNMKTGQYTEKNNATIQSLLSTLERLCVSINPKLLNILYFCENQVVVEKEINDEIIKLCPNVYCLDKSYREKLNFKKLECDSETKNGVKIFEKEIDELSNDLKGFYGRIKRFSFFLRSINIFRKKMKVKLIQQKNEEGNYSIKPLLPDSLLNWLKNHQKESIYEMWRKEIMRINNWNKTLFLSMMGTGKSATILIFLKLLLDNLILVTATPVLLITTKSVCYVWSNENKKICNDFNLKKYRVRILTDIREASNCIIPEIVKNENYSHENPNSIYKQYFVIMSISFLKNILKQNQQDQQEEFFFEMNGLNYKISEWILKKKEVLIVDEPQEFSENELKLIKNIKSDRTIIMTATCVKNSIIDYLNIIDSLNLQDDVKKELNRATNNKSEACIKACCSYTTTNSYVNENYVENVFKHINLAIPNVIINTGVTVEDLLLRKGKKTHKYIISPKLSRRQYVLINFLAFLYSKKYSIITNEGKKVPILNLLNLHQAVEQIIFGFYDSILKFILKKKEIFKKIYNEKKEFQEFVHFLSELKDIIFENNDCVFLNDFISSEKIDPSIKVICGIASFFQEVQEFNGMIVNEQVQILKKMEKLMDDYNTQNQTEQLKKNPFKKPIDVIKTNKIVSFFGEDLTSQNKRKAKIKQSMKSKSIMLASKDIIKVGMNCNWNRYLILCGIDWCFSNDIQTMGRIVRLSNEKDSFIFRIIPDDIVTMQKMGVNWRKGNMLKMSLGKNVSSHNFEKLKEIHRKFHYEKSDSPILNSLFCKIKPLINNMYKNELLFS